MADAMESKAEVSEAGEVRESRWRDRRDNSERLRQAVWVFWWMVWREEVRSWIRVEGLDGMDVMWLFLKEDMVLRLASRGV